MITDKIINYLMISFTNMPDSRREIPLVINHKRIKKVCYGNYWPQ